jgi:hypothetical protein
MEAVAQVTEGPATVRFIHRLIVTLRSGFRTIILAFSICLIAEVLRGYLLGFEINYYYLPNITHAPSLGFIPGEYALPLLFILRMAIPVAVFLLFYARSIYPKQSSEWAISIFAMFMGSFVGNFIGWDIFVISNSGVVPFFYSWYAILIFSGNWFNISIIGLGGMLAANLRHIRHTRD